MASQDRKPRQSASPGLNLSVLTSNVNSSENLVLLHRGSDDSHGKSHRSNSSDRPLSTTSSSSQISVATPEAEKQEGNSNDPVNTRMLPNYTRPSLPWQQRSALKLETRGLPPKIDTTMLFDFFQQFGNVVYIDIVDECLKRQPKAYVIFRPVPDQAFWDQGRLLLPQSGRRDWWIKVSLMQETFWQIGTSLREYPEVVQLPLKRLEIGVLYNPTTMKIFHVLQQYGSAPSSIRLHLRHKRLEVEFGKQIPEAGGNKVFKQWYYRFALLLRNSFRIFTIGGADQKDSTAIIISADSPPEFSRRYDSGDSSEPGKTIWDIDRNPWHRVVDLGSRRRSKLPVSLHNSQANVRIGSWTTYKVDLDKSSTTISEFKQFLNALEDFNRPATHISKFDITSYDIPSVFDLLESQPGDDVDSLDLQIEFNKVSLSFEIRYQLEVCISEGYLSEYNLDRNFLDKLNSMAPDRARGLLVGVAAQKKKYFDPMKIFNEIRIKPDRTQLPQYCFYSRSVVITPTTMYVATPSLDVSNRVIRRFCEHTDRFLRVHFSDERPSRRIGSAHAENKTEVYARVKDVLMNGIVLGNRHYHFLAFGNSQLKESSAYFFCPTDYVTTSSMRLWMGDFEDKVVAKYAARLGQCFSTTRAIHGARFELGRMDDEFTDDRQHCFTDGVGIISDYITRIAASEMGALKPDDSTPSALQFRLGGCKGVLVNWPPLNFLHKGKDKDENKNKDEKKNKGKDQKQDRDLLIRKSQEKFHARYQGLEIVRWSQFSSAYLNRQFITILTTLGVKDRVFLDMLNTQLADLDEAMTDPRKAARLLTRDIDPNQISIEVASIANNHFMEAEEPFMMSVLQLWRAYTIKYLKEKARLLVDQGAHLLGVIDEIRTLRGFLDEGPIVPLIQIAAAKEQAPAKDPLLDGLPEIFVQVPWPDERTGELKYRVIEGPVLLARHPSLFPSDIRVVRAVDKAALRHLRDVVVLPKRGKRDLASMCSGGDLDGDDFVVIWDKRLLPKEWNLEAPLFTAPPPLTEDNPITIDDITTFFVKFIQNDTLGMIANAHLAWSDSSPDGAKDEKCIELARLASVAVDYAKNGHSAKMVPNLRPKYYPHFMEKIASKTYHSKTALGQLYDSVQLVDFSPNYDLSFDDRILSKATNNRDVLNKAAEIKVEYDEAVQRIMNQHGIKWELEVWSTFVLNHDDESNDFKFHEIIGRLSSSLKETFRNRCYEVAGGREYEKIAPFVAAMYKVTSLKVQDAMNSLRNQSSKPGCAMPFISFPWIFSTVLGHIATGRVPAATAQTSQITPHHTTNSALQASEIEIRPANQVSATADKDDSIETGGQTIHRGEMLELFNNLGKNDRTIGTVEDLLVFDDEIPGDIEGGRDAVDTSGSGPQQADSVSVEYAASEPRLEEESPILASEMETDDSVHGVARSITVSTALDELVQMLG